MRKARLCLCDCRYFGMTSMSFQNTKTDFRSLYQAANTAGYKLHY